MTATADYLNRLAVEAEPPSVDALFRLHRAQVERITYETFWIHLRQPWGVDPQESLHRLATTRRGGYCFQLNGALGIVLRELGYRTSWHAAGVHDAAGPTEASLGNHVAVIVDDLPTPANPGGRWYVDAGLGDALYEPLAVQRGITAQGPMRFGLNPTAAGEIGDWHLVPDRPGSFAGVSIVDRPVSLDRFAARNVHNATSPESGFARTVTAQRRHALGTAVLRGCVLTRTDTSTTTTHTCTSRSEWLHLIDDEFGVVLDAPRGDIENLWSRVQDAHAAWLETEATA